MPRNRVRIGMRRHHHAEPPQRDPVELAVGAAAGSRRAATSCRGAHERGCASPTQSRASSSVERRRRRTRPPACPTPRRVRRAPRPPSTAGCSRSRAATAGAGTLTPPLTTMSSTRPSTCSRPSSSSRPASEVRNQPSTSTSRGQLRVAVVPVEEHRARRSGSVRRRRWPDRDPVQRDPVVDAAARGLRRAVRRHHAHPGVGRARRGAPGRSGRRRAAPCGSVRSASTSASSSSRCSWVGHQGDERRPRRRSTAAASEAWSSSSTGGVRRPTSDRQTTCTPGDVRRRQRQQPAARRRRAGARSRRPRRAPRRGTAPPASAHRSSRTSRPPAARVVRAGEPRATARRRPRAVVPRRSTRRALAVGRALLESLGRGNSRPVARRRATAHPARSGLPRARRHRRRGVRRRAPSGGRRCSRSSSAWRSRSAVNYANDYSDGIRGTDADRVGPMRLVGSGAAPAGRGEAGGVPGVRRRRASPGWCSPPRPPGGWSRSGCVSRARRLVLHRRLEALRLPRPRRGDGVRLLRPGRGVGTTYVQTETWELGRAVRRRRRSARWPARSWSPTTCATSRPTPSPASAPWRSCSATDRTRLLYAAAGARRRGRPWSRSPSPRPGACCSASASWCSPPRRVRTVLGGATGPGLVPVLQADRPRRAALGGARRRRAGRLRLSRPTGASPTYAGDMLLIIVLLVVAAVVAYRSGCRCWPRCSASPRPGSSASSSAASADRVDAAQSRVFLGAHLLELRRHPLRAPSTRWASASRGRLSRK